MKNKGRSGSRPFKDKDDRRERPATLRPIREPRKPESNALYGVLPVLEALRSGGRRIEKILVAEGVRQHRLQEIYDLARENRVIVETAPRERLDKLVAEDVNHQGLLAIAAAADYVDADKIFHRASEPALFVVLDGVEDPRNLGAILRSAECSGADGIVIPERRAVGLTETVAKASAGAIEHIDVAKVTNLNRFIEGLKERNIWVVGTSGDAAMSYTDWDWKTSTALVLGSEGSGLHRLVAENCDALVKIPMYGKIDSLNVSVAAGVILFEARRQREAGRKLQVESSISEKPLS